MIGNVPDGWRVEKLSECGRIITGKTPSKAVKEYWNSNDVSFIKPDDFTKNTVIEFETGKDFVSFEGFKKAPKIPPYSVLTTCIGNIGKVLINKNEASSNQQINSIVPNKDIHYKFLAYSIIKIKPIMLQRANAPVVPMINKTDFGKYTIPIPPLPQQEKIVKVLDISSSLIEKQELLIKQYDLFLKSKFIEMFGDPIRNPMGWEAVKLETITDKITDGTHKTPAYKSSGVKFVSAKNIKNETLNFNNCKYISLEEHNTLIKRCNPEYKNILLTKSGSIGMSSIVPKVDFPFSLFESLCLIKFDIKILEPFYLREFLNSDSTKYQYKGLIKGIAIKHLHLKDIRSIKITLPPITLQNKFASIVEKIETIKAKETKKLEQLQTLHKSLMDKAFKGEIG